MVKKEKKRKEKYRKIRKKNTANKKLVASKALSNRREGYWPKSSDGDVFVGWKYTGRVLCEI